MNKPAHIIFQTAICLALGCALIPIGSAGQAVLPLRKINAYKKEVLSDANKRLIDLQEYIPSLQTDLRYSTPYNFTGKQLYPRSEKPMLAVPAAEAIRQIQEQLSGEGLALFVWDAYRPHRATRLMWKLIKDERYVANPKKGSGHNRGLALDLTIADLKTGNLLEMGTGFDHFSDTAHHSFTRLPQQMLNNRAKLRTIMESHGFKALETEWWHYTWPNQLNYAVLDISSKKIKRANATMPPPTSPRRR